jgi:hypothetical protein
MKFVASFLLSFLLAATALCKVTEGNPVSPDKRFRVGPGSAEDQLAMLIAWRDIKAIRPCGNHQKTGLKILKIDGNAERVLARKVIVYHPRLVILIFTLRDFKPLEAVPRSFLEPAVDYANTVG